MAHLRLNNVSVDFPLYQGANRSLKKSILKVTRGGTGGDIGGDARDRVSVHALRDLTFDLKDGDRLALLGPNGAGKTTLLKVMTGIYAPSTGLLEASGHISALLDVSVGLDPEATGYENIILRGMFMDIRPRDMAKHVSDIEEFTSLGNFLHMPVRTYSSGMMVRLAFAIATCVSPEILLMDEWLSAGDASFFEKAQKRMDKFVTNSSIMVLASHSLPLLDQWCNRAILLNHGRIEAIGDVKTVVAAYHDLINQAALSVANG